MSTISVIIPSKDEPYLQKTIDDIFKNSHEDTEVIAVLDGYWPNPPLNNNDKLHVLHRGGSNGMRNAINSAVELSRSEYIMKLDAHCMLDDGFDSKLLADCKGNTILIPTRKRLDPVKWEITETNKRDVNYMELDSENRGRIIKKNDDPKLDSEKIVETNAFQGSCYFMKRSYYKKLGLLDDINFGQSGHEAQEIYFKVAKNGGKVLRDKNTWYAHWHKGNKNVVISGKEVKKSREYMKEFIKQPKAFKRRQLAGLFRDMGFKKGAEIGVRHAKYSTILCETIPGLDLMSIDPYTMVFQDKRSRELGVEKTNEFYEEAKEKLSKFPGCKLIKKESLQAVQDVPYESLDFVYIDGSHEFDYVMCDIIEWSKRVRKGGIVSGHDYYRFKDAAVVDSVDMYVKQHGVKKLSLTTEKNAKSWYFIKE